MYFAGRHFCFYQNSTRTWWFDIACSHPLQRWWLHLTLLMWHFHLYYKWCRMWTDMHSLLHWVNIYEHLSICKEWTLHKTCSQAYKLQCVTGQYFQYPAIMVFPWLSVQHNPNHAYQTNLIQITQAACLLYIIPHGVSKSERWCWSPTRWSQRRFCCYSTVLSLALSMVTTNIPPPSHRHRQAPAIQ